MQIGGMDETESLQLKVPLGLNWFLLCLDLGCVVLSVAKR